jgi:protocatechuate 3,4-dioxygenase beta subunit
MSAIRFVIVFAVVVGQPVLVPGQQRTPARPANEQQVVVRGQVVDDDSGASLARARVTTQVPGVATELSFADERGLFEVRVPAGSSRTLRISKAGFVPVTVSAEAPRPVRGQEPLLEIRMVRGGVIAGRALDELGKPVVSARVRARRTDVAAERNRAASPPELSTTTDDQGEYRLSGLVAGHYGVSLFSTELSLEMQNGLAAGRNASPVPLLPQGTGQVSPEQLAEMNRLLKERAESRIRQLESPLGSGEVVVDVARGREVRVFHDRIERPGGSAANVLTSVGAQSATVPGIGIRPDPGVVSGRVVDDAGGPMEGVIVELRRIGYLASGRALESAAASRTTDDRGQFRLYGVAPGSYFLAVYAAAEESARAVYAPRFHPDRSTISEAVPIVVELGRELSGLTITFSPSRSLPLSGMVFDAAGQPRVTGVVGLAANTPSGALALQVEARIGTDGSFEIPSVAPGEYILQAVGKGSSGVREMGVIPVSVTSGDSAPVLITTLRGSRFAGRVVFEGGAPKQLPPGFGIIIVPSDPAYAAMLSTYDGGFVDGDGTFAITGLVGPGRLALASVREGWWVKSVRVGGEEMADTPVMFGRQDRDGVNVVLSSAGGRIEGNVVDAAKLGMGVSVAVFPVDRSRWFYRSRFLRLLRLSTGGRFSIPVPPGDYWVAAVGTSIEESVYGSWQNDEFLSALIPAARRVTLEEGQRAVLTLTPVRAPN